MRTRFKAAQLLVLGLAAAAVLLVWAFAPHRLARAAYAIVLGVVVVEAVLWFVGQAGPGEGARPGREREQEPEREEDRRRPPADR